MREPYLTGLSDPPRHTLTAKGVEALAGLVDQLCRSYEWKGQ